MRRYLILLSIFLVLVASSRLPLAPAQLFSFDDVNMALAMGEFDPRLSQPQLPGYPLFVLEMRALRLFGFKRPESNLIGLSLLGSVATLMALVWCGERLLGRDAGLIGALLMVFHPSFWYAGLTSALRVQLALVSAVVAAACWRLWTGERRWLFYSALALGLGAGIRPELGPLLLPLWIVGLARARASWLSRVTAAGVLIAAVAAWFVPTILNSGGWNAYWVNTWGYISGQARLTSPLFGAEPVRWRATIVWLACWAFSGCLLAPMLAVLAWKSGRRLLPMQVAFFVLWLAPSILFAFFVHVQDPGQTLVIVAPVCLLTAHWVLRAVAARDLWRSPSWDIAFPALIGALIVVAPLSHPGVFLIAAAVLSLLCAIVVRIGPGVSRNEMASTPALGFVLLPSLALFVCIFASKGWYYRDPGYLSASQLWSQINSGFAQSGLAQVREITGTDDLAIRAIRRAAAERPGHALVIWMRSPATWRKVTYYLPHLPLIELELQGSAPLAKTWRGSREVALHEGATPLHISVPVGSRLIWLTEPRSAFAAAVRQTFPGIEAGPIYYHDLPASGGSRVVGDFILEW